MSSKLLNFKFIKIYSLKPVEEILQLIESSKGNEHMRVLQKALAEELTARIHSDQDLESAKKTTEVFFGNGDEKALKDLSKEDFIAGIEGLETFFIGKESFINGITLVDLLTQFTSILPSKTEARKMIQSNSIAINKMKIIDANALIAENTLIFEKYLVIQKGKKNYYLVEVN